jgi:hypothetical protein
VSCCAAAASLQLLPWLTFHTAPVSLRILLDSMHVTACIPLRKAFANRQLVPDPACDRRWCWVHASACRCPTCSANLTISSLKPAQLQQRPAAAGSPAGGGGAAPQLVREPRGVEDDGPFVVCDSKLMKLKEVRQHDAAAAPPSTAQHGLPGHMVISHLPPPPPRPGACLYSYCCTTASSTVPVHVSTNT